MLRIRLLLREFGGFGVGGSVADHLAAVAGVLAECGGPPLSVGLSEIFRPH